MKVHTVPIDPIDDPLSHRPDHVWMSPDTSLWGWGEASQIDPGTGDGRMASAARSFAAFAAICETDDSVGLPGTGPVAFTSLTFSPSSVGSRMVVPSHVVGRRGDTWWATSLDGAARPPSRPVEERAPDRARYAGSSVPDVLWMEAVAEAVARIRDGDLDKVVLARDYALWSRTPFVAEGLLRRLARRFPQCHVFAVAGLLGASPELLLRRRGRQVESLVLAGSAPTFPDRTEDAAAGRALLVSPKDMWEHELAVRSVQEALAPVSAHLDVAGTPEILRLDNVQHLATQVRATTEAGDDALALVDRLHPTAAVGGTPTPAALSLIEELEGMDRGRYAGPVGWIDRHGDGDFAIALRCAEFSGARARLFAGAGIVADSLPEDELEETRIKLGAMMGALGSG